MRALPIALMLVGCGAAEDTTSARVIGDTGGTVAALTPASATVGTAATGGTAPTATGGTAQFTGGAKTTGGTPSTGGEPATGGAAATGGSAATGGAATGGTTGLIAGTNYTTLFGLGTSLNCCASGQIQIGAFECYDCPAGGYGCIEVPCSLVGCDACFHACANLEPLSGRNYVFINSCGAAP